MVAHQLPTHMDVKKVLKNFRNTLKYHSEVIAVKKLHLTLMQDEACLLYTSPSPRDLSTSRMPSSA